MSKEYGTYNPLFDQDQAVKHEHKVQELQKKIDEAETINNTNFWFDVSGKWFKPPNIYYYSAAFMLGFFFVAVVLFLGRLVGHQYAF